MSAWCQQETHAPQQTASLYDHLAGAGNLLDSERRDFWLAEAEEWGQRALDEIAFHFRECNGACVTGAATNPTSNESPHV
jgi:hypothetical protein